MTERIGHRALRLPAQRGNIAADTDSDPAMSHRFDTDSDLPAPLHLIGCGCAQHSRRLFGAGLLAAGAAAALPAWADGVVVDDRSALAKLAPADQLQASP